MKPGELRRLRDNFHALGAEHLRGRTFMVLRVNDSASCDPPRPAVDILIDGRVETDLGYFWVKDSSEVLNAAR